MSMLLKVDEVAEQLALHPHTVNRALNGQIKLQLPPAFKLGGRWRFRADDVRDFIDNISGRVTVSPAQAAEQQAAHIEVKRGPGRPRKSAGGAA